MKLEAEIDGVRHQLELERIEGSVFASIDGRRYELEVSTPEPNVFLLKHDGRVKEVYVLSPANTSTPFVTSSGGREVSVSLIDPKRLHGSGAGSEHTSGLAEIKTAMPGKVVRILVAEGDAVSKGDGVIVVEAMKMQNEMKAPKDGVVSEIKVAENDTVGAGDTLIVID